MLRYPDAQINPDTEGAWPRASTALSWIAGCCLLASLLLGACSNRTELDDSVKNLVFHTLEGEKIALNATNHPTLVSFWSTSCVVCLEEMPAMAQLYRRYSDAGFQLIAVAMPYDAPNEVLELSEQQNFPFPVALDVKGEALSAFSSVKGTPTSFLLDAEGQLVKQYTGAIDMAGLRRELDKLLELG